MSTSTPSYHHTAPISLNFALYEALRMVAEEGLVARWERHKHNAELLWDGLEELGMSLHVRPRTPTSFAHVGSNPGWC